MARFPAAVPCPPKEAGAQPKHGQGCDCLDKRIVNLWLLAEVGRLRLPFSKPFGVNLPAIGAPSVQLAENNGHRAMYVRVQAIPGAGALTFFTGSAEAAQESSHPINTGVVPFVEYILYPSERLFGANQGGAAYRAIVYQVDIPYEMPT